MEVDQIIHGDCLRVLRTFPSNTVDSVVTDPPYGLSQEPDIREVLTKWLNGEDYTHRGGGFMGKTWDSFVPGPAIWREVYRVLKPGGHALVFAGTRTQDLMTTALRLAGFEVRDVIEWLYFSGFPKSLDVGKAIDSMERGKLVSAKIRYFREARGLSMSELAALIGVGTNNIHDWEVGGHAPSERRWNEIKEKLGVSDEEEQMFERTVIGEVEKLNSFSCEGGYRVGGRYDKKIIRITAPATDLAQKWSGWGTALKPAHEPIIVVRKPLIDADTGRKMTVADCVEKYGTGAINIDACRIATEELKSQKRGSPVFDETANGLKTGWNRDDYNGVYTPNGAGRFPANCVTTEPDAFFSKYFNVTPPELSKKASRKDRNSDWMGSEIKVEGKLPKHVFGDGFNSATKVIKDGDEEAIRKGELPEGRTLVKNNHPTVKPVDLMAWLVRLVTPPGGVVLDPFAGSGSTCVAARREGFFFIGIERELEYVEIARKRVGGIDTVPEGQLTLF